MPYNGKPILQCSCGQRMRLPKAPHGTRFKCVACGKIMQYHAPEPHAALHEIADEPPNKTAHVPSEDHKQFVRECLERQFPTLARYRDWELPYFHLNDGNRLIEGFCWFDAPPAEWIHERGGEMFALDDETSQSYIAYGREVRRTEGECLFFLIREAGRHLAFYDQYSSHANPSDDPVGQTAKYLDEAMARWERGDKTVVFSGSLGWLDPETRIYKSDYL